MNLTYNNPTHVRQGQLCIFENTFTNTTVSGIILDNVCMDIGGLINADVLIGDQTYYVFFNSMNEDGFSAYIPNWNARRPDEGGFNHVTLID